MGTKIDLTGKKFGKLSVIKDVGRNVSKKILWLCKCDCGNEKVIDGGSLRIGDTISCGCKKATTHGKSGTKEYRVWADMLQRCNNPKSTNYKYYGMKGISVCKEWAISFEQFLNDMGVRPSRNHSIDRIEVTGNYNKDNCHWTTRKFQDNNKNDSVIILVNGERIFTKDFALMVGVTSTAICEYIRNHSMEKAVSHYLHGIIIKKT